MYSCQTNILVPHLDLSGDYNVLMPNQYTGSSLGLVRRLQCTHAKPIYWFLTWTCQETTMYSCQTNILYLFLTWTCQETTMYSCQTNIVYWFLTWTCQETTMYSCQTNIVVPHLDLSGDYNVLMPNQSTGSSLELVRRLQCTHTKPIYCTGSSLGLVRRLQCTHAKPIYWFLTWTCQETTMYSYQTNILVPHLDLSGDYNVLIPNQYTVLVPHLDLSGDYNVLVPNQYTGPSL